MQLRLWMHNPVTGERRLRLEEGTQQDKMPCFWQRAKRVHMLIRSDGLAKSMSRYLIRQIEETPNIILRPYTEIIELIGDNHLQSVRWQNSKTGHIEEHNINHVFVMTGADPNTSWLDGCVVLDNKGFIKTGSDLSTEELNAVAWPLARQPYLLETSLPG